MSDLDLPLLPSAEQIRRRTFATVRRGYDPDQVQGYLQQIASQVETLEHDLREERLQASGRPDAPAPAATPAPVATPAPAGPAPSAEEAYEQLSARFATVLRTADEESQRLIADARLQATKILEEAQAEADKIRLDAQSNAEEARAKSAAELERARVEADRVVGGLEQRREAMLTQMHEMQSRLLAVAQDLDVPEIEPGPGGEHAAPPAVTPQPPSPPKHAPAPQPATSAPPAVPTKPAPPATATAQPVGKAPSDDDVDPRYEDLWAPNEGTAQVDLPDLSVLDIDFDDEERSSED
jgi:cell division initiation protein